MDRPFHCLIMARVLPLFCWAVPTPPAAQSQEVMIRGTGQTVPVCKLTDLDSNVSFFSAGTDVIVVVNLQNLSQSPCVPQPVVGLPFFGYAQGPQIEPFNLCIDCEDRLPNGQYRFHDPVALNPGEIAHQTYRWNSVAPSESGKCSQLQTLPPVNDRSCGGGIPALRGEGAHLVSQRRAP